MATFPKSEMEIATLAENTIKHDIRSRVGCRSLSHLSYLIASIMTVPPSTA